MSGRTIVIFGAGAAGRGLVGLLFAQAGCRVVFVDIKDDLVKRLGSAGRYSVLLHRLAGGQEEQSVEGFLVLHARDREAVAREIVTADFVMTAVFAQNLPDVAQTIALGVVKCREAQRAKPLNIIACENMKKSSSTLRGYVAEHLGEADRAFMNDVAGFPDCMINRVVPNPVDPLAIETEDYCEWTVEAGAVKGAWPAEVDFIERVENQAARLDRKLFVYNGSHAACAYFGHGQGCSWIHEAIDHPRVTPDVEGVLAEMGQVVCRHHGFAPETMGSYKQDFRLRCRNLGLKDAVSRIGRQPARKLGRQERFIAPAKLAQEYGLPRRSLMKAIAAALFFVHPDDPDSQTLAERVRADGWRKTLGSVSGLAESDPLMDELAVVIEEEGRAK
jgi:mannitol-1-phosphate 5-dehydrogenase